MDVRFVASTLVTLSVLVLSKAHASRQVSHVVSAVGNWLEWSHWTDCTERVYCLEGSTQRARICETGKRCVGIEEESEDCPKTLCEDRPVLHDVLNIDEFSFIHEECHKPVKYHVKGKYATFLKHNLSNIFPKARNFIEQSFFNTKLTKKLLNVEKDILKYCFEPESKSLTLKEFSSLFSTVNLRFKYTTIFRPLPKRNEPKYVTGYVIGVQDSEKVYAIYAQVTTNKGFHSVYYMHMPGYYSPVHELIWE